MTKIIVKIKNWISTSFQLITVGLLIALLILVIKQQKELDDLYDIIDESESRFSNDINDAKEELSTDINDAKEELSSDIDDVKRTVRIWSN
jgi:hypothetical protein